MLVNAEEWGSKRTVGPNGRKTRQKIRMKKKNPGNWVVIDILMLATVWQIFDSWRASNHRKRLRCQSAENWSWKNSWNLNEWTYFVADFNAFGITVKRSRHAIQRPQARPRAHYGRRLPSVEDTKALTLLSLRTTRKKTDVAHGPVGSKGARARPRAVCDGGGDGRLSSWLSRKSSVQVWTTWSYYVDAWRSIISTYVCSIIYLPIYSILYKYTLCSHVHCTVLYAGQ